MRVVGQMIESTWKEKCTKKSLVIFILATMLMANETEKADYLMLVYKKFTMGIGLMIEDKEKV